jgi:ABC-type Na+ efflux pump permease subunit
LYTGPIIAREVVTAPRTLRFFIMRGSYAGIMFVLMWTAWQFLVGWQDVRDVGILARFGSVLYYLFAIGQLTVMLFFAPLSAATVVAHEKDRRTFVLLLMTDLSDLEIVLGKLAASLTQVLGLLAAGLPVLVLCVLLGGISFIQVANLFLVTAASGIAGGALGLIIALWRDRTFQSMSLTLLMVVFSIVGVEAIAYFFPTVRVQGVPLVEVLNPYRAMLAALYPSSDQLTGLRASSYVYVTVRLLFAASIIALGTWRLRTWNPGKNEPRELREGEEPAEDLIEVTAEPARPQEVSMGLHVPRRTHRRVVGAARSYRIPWFDYPVLWREVRTRAYGSKPLIIKFIYLVLCLMMVVMMANYYNAQGTPDRAARSILPVAILSLLLINAQAVTALTSERDSGALDLLLVTELTPRQFIYGKLYGALHNAREMLLLPIIITVYFVYRRALNAEEAFYAITDFLLLAHFSAMLGLHAGITYTNSRTAISNSLGTLFFLLAGILICAYLIILGDREFGRQLLSFLLFIGAGSIGLFSSLGARNPSQAIALVALLTPFWTFYCVVSLLRGDVMAAFLFSVGIYGFALLAMLVPAVSDFDIQLGRTSAIQG